VALARSLADSAERIREAAGHGRPIREVLRFIEGRTVFFDDAVLGAIDRGVTQVVIFGAGYDGRALRFRTPGVRFFEVDHPATQADKRRRLADLDVATTGITFVEADFTEPGLEQRLADAGHESDEPTQFLVEGVLRYLPEVAVHDLLATSRRRAAADSRLAVSISTRSSTEDGDAAAARRAGEQRLADAGEPVLTVPPRDVALGWLTHAGWAITSVAELQHRAGRLLVTATT
jgi:methyltransferase (TIGR00027 family)